MKTFEELGVSEEIRRAIEEMGFEKPMPVQEEVIPFLLGTRNDVIALAQTGTGKTAAFGIPLLQRIDTRIQQTQAIVLSPTRELCLQIADDLKDFSKYVPDVHVIPVYGGANIETQIRQLKKGVHIIVATPGRLIDLMNRGVAKLGAVCNVVLDEADEMLNMGFSEDLNTILAGVPEERNTLLFSATMSKEIEKIARTYLHDPKEIVVGSRNEGAENVNHIYYMVSAKDKYLALKRIVDFHPRIFAIIFCRTKVETQEIADKLIKDGYNAESLHGDLSQQQRDLTMQKFRQHLTQLLVATDVAARGLDVDDLTHVINYGMPDDIENYIHRSGRTGRAGKKGTSIAIVHTREKSKIRQVERQLGKEFVAGEMPTPQEICKKQLYKVMDQIVKTDVDEAQIEPFLQDISRFFEFIDKEDLIKKIVSVEFGKFLAYYADAPEIRIETGKKERSEGKKDRKERGKGGRRQAEEGYRRLFINLGKKDGFYPGEVMQFINRNVKGRVAVGHIDLQNTFSFIEVPQEDAERVMNGLTGTVFKGRDVRCNDADEGGKSPISSKKAFEPHGKKRDFRPSRSRDDWQQPKREKQTKFKKEDWMKFLNPDKLKGDIPDFSEEGWARRRPKKKK
ncbi:MAG: DEAD/DEAH box helicase [Prevotella sp.]|nr:DEAD/DEAH box helicase [Prevotella sp.]